MLDRKYVRPEPTRREAIIFFAAGAAVSLSGCSLPPAQKPPGTSSKSTSIDVHCHVFNAQDLPVTGFVQDVVLSDLPELGYPLGPLIKLIALAMDGQAISAKDELAQIQKANASAVAGARNFRQSDVIPPSVTNPALVRPTDDDLVRGRIIDAVKRFQVPDAKAAKMHQELMLLMPEMNVPGENPDEAALLRQLAGRAPGQESLLIPGSREELLQFPLKLQVTPDEVANGILSIKDDVYGVFLMASLMTRPRSELADRLATLPSKDANEISLFVPAIIDYSYWLGDFEVTPLDEQVAVMSAIAAVPTQRRATPPSGCSSRSRRPAEVSCHAS